MQKSVLVEIVRSLNRKETREIHKWLQSPAHNLRDDVVQLFEYLNKVVHTDEAALAKETVWKALFVSEAFDDARIRQTMYFLLQTLEEYLAFTELSKDKVHIQTVLLKVYRNRQLERPFRLMMEAARKRQQTSMYRNVAFLNEQHVLEQEMYYHLVNQKWSMGLNLQETANALDQAYIADKLRISCRMLAHQSLYKKVEYDMGFLTSTLQYVEQNNLLREPAIAVYYYGYKTLTERENQQYFDELEKLILEKGSLFPVNELREIYLLAINYCVGRFNMSGDIIYASRAFTLFKKGFEDNVLLENGLISRFTFGNVIAFGLRLKEFAWVENFIEKFQHNIEEKFRRSAVHFNQSRLFFEKGDYDKAQRLLMQFEYDDMVLNIIAKTMLLKIYYEQGELDAFESLLESMRIYLQRKEALDSHRKAAYKNLVSIMKKLLHTNPYSKTQMEKLRKSVDETNPLMEREWLLAQISKK